MSAARPRVDGQARALALLILVQAVCAVFFAGDIIADAVDTGRGFLADPHLVIEALAVAALAAAIVIEARFLMQMLRRTQLAADSLRVAAGAFWEVLEDRFAGWGLTPAEREVAAFTVKGLSVAEVAALRGAAEGTVKAQLGAVYRKAGVTGRHQLVTLLIEDLLAEPLPAESGAETVTGASQKPAPFV